MHKWLSGSVRRLGKPSSSSQCVCVSVRQHSVITTPIFYVNGPPHIGHLYSALLGDVLSRWHAVRDPAAAKHSLLTGGTDEHGIKIQRSAGRAGVEPLVYCDRNSALFKHMFDTFGINATHFTRTTDERHLEAVTKFWVGAASVDCSDNNKDVLSSRGYINKSAYCGWYSTIDEMFYGEAEVKPSDEDPSVMCFKMTRAQVSTSTGHRAQWVQEDNYMFSTEQLYSKIRNWLTDENVITPSQYLPQVLAQIKNQEISLSRDASRVPWGIPVPGDPSQTIYVWFDALINYLTAVGYPDKLGQWPPTTQVVGKEILRFHAVLWPAMLMAAELPLPGRLSIHGHWLCAGTKMSKSKQNVVDPFEEAQLLGVDGLRYYLLRQGVTHEDANFERTRAIRICNAELANNLGNLLQRSVSESLNADQVYPHIHWDVFNTEFAEQGQPLVDKLNTLPERIGELYESHQIYKAMDLLQKVLTQTNSFMQACEPWQATEMSVEVSTCLGVVYESLRCVSILLQPVAPNVAGAVLDRLGVSPANRSAANATPFERTPVSQCTLPLGNKVPPPYARVPPVEKTTEKQSRTAGQ